MRNTLVTTLLALAVGAGSAGAADFGIGAFGGVSIPVLNDLAKQGPVFGVRVPANLLPLLTVEPYFSTSTLGNVEDSFGTPTTYTRDGGKVTGFGVNALVTFGAATLKLYPFAGVGSYKVTREGSEDVSEIGYNFGLGLGVSPVPKLTVHVRGGLDMVATGDTSQKFATVTAGVSYAVFSMP